MIRVISVRSVTAAFMAASLAASLAACHGNLDFGIGSSTGGLGGGGRSGTGGASSGGSGGAICATDGDCRLGTLHCDVGGSRTCVECVADTHCAIPGFRRCDPALHRCVACVVATDCAATQACVAARCVTTCVENVLPGCAVGSKCESGLCATCDDDISVCAGSPATPFCLEPPRICVGCRSDGDCGGTTPRCDPVRNTCVQCTKAADCGSAGALCDPVTGVCTAG